MDKYQLYFDFYESLFKIRSVEEKIAEIYHTDKIKSPIHLSNGQESISVGVCKSLHSEDLVFGTYRGHALYLAKGGSLDKMMAELYGKIDGCCRGKGGSMHLADVSKGIMSTSAIVATTIPLSVGSAFAQNYKKNKNLTVCFFGEGAIDEGATHESMQFSVLNSVPIVYVCENNQYAIHSHQKTRHFNKNFIKDWVSSYGIEYKHFEKSDPISIYEYMNEIRTSLVKRPRPIFIECNTYRWKEHVGPLDNNTDLEYSAEISQSKEDDFVMEYGEMLKESDKVKIESKVLNEIKSALQFAENSKFPTGNKILFDDLYS